MLLPTFDVSLVIRVSGPNGSDGWILMELLHGSQDRLHQGPVLPTRLCAVSTQEKQAFGPGGGAVTRRWIDPGLGLGGIDHDVTNCISCLRVHPRRALARHQFKEEDAVAEGVDGWGQVPAADIVQGQVGRCTLDTAYCLIRVGV